MTSSYNIYKFGGASIASAERIKNVSNIICSNTTPLIVVVSALGKSTNELEAIIDSVINNESGCTNALYELFVSKHRAIAEELSLPQELLLKQEEELKDIITSINHCDDYDKIYDTIVSYGELFSSTLIYNYLISLGVDTGFIDARDVISTDTRHRDANVDIELSRKLFLLAAPQKKVTITQGFIGASPSGATTTLGREGSDYSAAIFAVISNTKSLTIWKDVAGVLNADPRLYPDAILIPHLNYHDAVELSFSGAQVIHPKTIRPLQNMGITLHVRSFFKPHEAGSIIDGNESSINIPIITVKTNQILLTITPRNFAFVLEDSLEHIFSIVSRNKQRVGMIQSSAVNISLVIDNSRYFEEFISELKEHYKVAYNSQLEMITIRGDIASDEVKKCIEKEELNSDIYLTEAARRVVKIVKRRVPTELPVTSDSERMPFKR